MLHPVASGAQRQLAGVCAQYAPKPGSRWASASWPPALADGGPVMSVDALRAASSEVAQMMALTTYARNEQVRGSISRGSSQVRPRPFRSDLPDLGRSRRVACVSVGVGPPACMQQPKPVYGCRFSLACPFSRPPGVNSGRSCHAASATARPSASRCFALCPAAEQIIP